ncbi:hypothetical protein LX32DRAFT_645272 [Colletotrichum zoysiae]|uniref:Uncharacterized protein n=1 Tax=Colletotrichum zoysiae TaxID=1216348 RepID=A0AAD9H5B1_9PEZI|nr:hypothetical protein LX32DRAFT_645272 [Colletotrichum zoysiae]
MVFQPTLQGLLSSLEPPPHGNFARPAANAQQKMGADLSLGVVPPAGSTLTNGLARRVVESLTVRVVAFLTETRMQ